MSGRQTPESGLERSGSSQDTLAAPSIASSMATSTSSGSQQKEKSGAFSSLFHHKSGHHNSDPRDHQTLAALMAPAVSVAGAHNPFIIGGMREDGSRTKPSIGASKSDNESMASEASSLSSSPRKSRRHRIRSAFGRSLSPWRFHADCEKNSERKKNNGSSTFSFSRLSCRDSLDAERERKASADEASDGENVKNGLAPRNSAFGADFDSEDDSEDEEYVGIKKRETDMRNERKDKEERGEAIATSATSSPALESQDEEEDEDEDDSGEDSDDYIDFDEKTLDNTLFNAGCTDLHDAWLQNDGPHSHQGETPDEVESVIKDDYYGPNDFDAAWEGAGPSGHDEEDETLRAPNVVIGQFNNVLSPSKLVGEGMDVILAPEQDKASKKSSSSLRSRSPHSSSSGKVAGSLLSGQSSASDHKQEAKKDAEIKSRQLTASRPIFERNRCTITLIHGDYEKMSVESKRPKRYIVASDGSEESSYAIEWTIGTVLRDGDETLIVSVMETDAKLDATDSKHEDKAARQEHQRIRQSMAVILARRALAVLQRTRLSVKVSCQALHARHSRHFLLEMVDFYEPTMVVVGSRGLNSLKGVLLGSFSNYCVQKSPVPVMVVRKRLKLPALPRGRGDVVSNVRRKHLSLDQAIIEKDANVAEVSNEGGEDDEKEKINNGNGDGDDKDVVEKKESHSEEVQDARVDDDSTTIASSTLSEAEKIKEEVIAKDAESSTTLEERRDEVEPIRGRAKFTMGVDEDDDEDQRGRSRSRTNER